MSPGEAEQAVTSRSKGRAAWPGMLSSGGVKMWGGEARFDRSTSRGGCQAEEFGLGPGARRRPGLCRQVRPELAQGRLPHCIALPRASIPQDRAAEDCDSITLCSLAAVLNPAKVKDLSSPKSLRRFPPHGSASHHCLHPVDPCLPWALLCGSGHIS